MSCRRGSFRCCSSAADADAPASAGPDNAISPSRTKYLCHNPSPAIKIGFLYPLCCLAFVGKVSPQPQGMPDHPTLAGPHFRFTIVQEEGWVDISENENGERDFSGYCVEIIRSVASHANFTFDLLPPSGFGLLCNHSNVSESAPYPYGARYRGQYLCGQGDVQDNALRNTTYATDFYLGMFYITPRRRLLNKFTTPFVPPTDGGLQLFGTATHIRDIHDLISQQVAGKQGPVCLRGNTAYAEFIRKSLPDLQVIDVDFGVGTPKDIHRVLTDGECNILMNTKPEVTRHIMLLAENGLCLANGKSIGLIGDSLNFGFTQFGIGVRRDMPTDVIDTIDYWMNYLMTCPPTEQTCDSFAEFYDEVTGNGADCGYEPFPQEDSLSTWSVVGIVLAVVISILLLGLSAFNVNKRLARRKRVKKRFVQQIARNIRITSSPDDIPAEKLAQLFQHISQGNDVAHKEDFLLWISDIHLRFLSDADYAYLWKSIDTKGAGYVTPIDFSVYLRTCNREFADVYKELENMPKHERLKFSLRDLDRLKEEGEEGVRRAEYRIRQLGRSI